MNCFVRASILVVPLLAAACSGTGSTVSGDKVLLRIDPPAGATFVREMTATMSGNLVVRAEGKETRQNLIKDERRVFQDEILAIQDGKVQKVRRKILEWKLKRQGPGEPAPLDVSLASPGKSFVMIRTELGTEYEGAQDIPQEELRQNVMDALDAILSLPEKAVGVGETWEIDGDHIVGVFGGEGERGLKVREAQGTGRLERMEGRVAVLSVRIDAKGALRQLLDVGVTLSLTATFRLDTDARRVLSFEMAGTGTLAGEVDRAKGPAVYEGSFKAEAKASSRPK